MNISEICRHHIVSIDARASLREAAALMRSEHVGALVVTQQGSAGELALGIVTDRDLVVEALARELDVGRTNVGSLASHDLSAVPGDAGIAEALAAMKQAGVRRLLVTQGAGHLLGFVSADDLVLAMAEDMSLLAQALEAGLARERSRRGVMPAPSARPVFLPHGTPGMQDPIAAR